MLQTHLRAGKAKSISRTGARSLACISAVGERAAGRLLVASLFPLAHLPWTLKEGL